MPEKPFPITGKNTDQLVASLMRIIDELYENTLGAAQLGDVFSINKADDVLTIMLSTTGGLEKSGGALQIKVYASGGLQADANGLAVKCRADYGITSDANGLQLIKQTHLADASTSHDIPDPADTPASTDALRDDIVTNVIPAIETALNALGTTVNGILTRLENAKIVASP